MGWVAIVIACAAAVLATPASPVSAQGGELLPPELALRTDDERGRILFFLSTPEREGTRPAAGILRVEVRWRPVWSDRWTGDALEYPRPPTENYVLTDLRDATEYVVQARSVDAHGASEWSEQSAWTRSVSVPGAPEQVRAAKISGGFSVKWERPTDAGVRVSRHDLRYIRSDAADKSDPRWTEQTGSPDDRRTNRTVRNLVPGQSYDVQVRAVNDVGAGPWSDSATVLVLTLGAPSMRWMLFDEDGVFWAAWHAPAGDWASEILAYDLRYIREDTADKSDGNWTLVMNASISKDDFWRHRSAALDPAVQYRVQVRAVLEGSRGPWSFGVRTIPPQAPEPPRIVELDPGYHALHVTWIHPGNEGRRPITRYDLRYIRADASDRSDGNWTLVPGFGEADRTRTLLIGLPAGVAHLVQVRAVNMGGPGAWTRAQRAEPIRRPGRPSIQSIERVNDDFRVSWAAPLAGADGITSYDVRVIQPQLSETPRVVSWRSWTITGLVDRGDQGPTGGLKLTRYTFTGGSGDPLSPASFRTLTGVGDADSASYLVTGLSTFTRSERPHMFQVRAVNALGAGPWSDASSTPPKGQTDAPRLGSVRLVGDGIEVSWTAPANTRGGSITRYDLRYVRADVEDGSEPNWTERPAVWRAGTGAATSYLIDGLVADVAYAVQVRAWTEAGEGPWSESLTTARTAPSAVPAITRLEHGERSITVVWEPPVLARGEPEVSGYDMDYGRLDQPDSEATELRGLPADPTRSERAGLDEGQRYKVRIRALNAHGPGPWSGWSLTQEIPLGQAPGSATITALYRAGNALVVGWDPPDGDRSTGAITRYDLRYIDASAPDRSDARWTQQTDVRLDSSLTYTHQGFDPGVSYDVQVRAVSAAGPGPWSAARRTDATAGTPTITRIVRENEIPVVYWSPPAGFSPSEIDRYQVRYAPHEPADGAEAAWTERLTDGPSRHHLWGLDADVVYQVQVRAMIQGHFGPWSARRLTEAVARPGAPTVDSVVRRGVTLRVSWTAPADDGGSPITHYDVRYVRADETNRRDSWWDIDTAAWRAGTNPLVYSIIGVREDVDYAVQVRAVNAAGAGPWSSLDGGGACLRGSLGPGVNFVVAGDQGSVAEIEACARERGIVSLYTTVDGAYVSYIVGAPEFVNAPFAAAYAGGIPALTPLLAQRDEDASEEHDQGWTSEEILGAQSWPDCLRGVVSDGWSLVLARGGRVSDLVSCAQDRDIAALYSLQDGEWLAYIVGAPAVVNREFIDAFADGVPALTVLLVRRGEP